MPGLQVLRHVAGRAGGAADNARHDQGGEDAAVLDPERSNSTEAKKSVKIVIPLTGLLELQAYYSPPLLKGGDIGICF